MPVMLHAENHCCLKTDHNLTSIHCHLTVSASLVVLTILLDNLVTLNYKSVTLFLMIS